MGLARCFSSHKGSVTFLQLGDAFVELSTFWSLFLLFNSMSLSLHTQSRNVSIMTIMMTQTFLIVLNNFWSMIDCRWYSFFSSKGTEILPGTKAYMQLQTKD